MQLCVPCLPGRNAVEPRKRHIADSLRGWKLTSAICLLSSCVALSALPAARWSAAWEESAHLRFHTVKGLCEFYLKTIGDA